MISFDPTEEQQLFLDNASAFARSRLRPMARDTEARRGLSPALLDEARALGLGGLDVPATAGGLGLGLLDAVLVDEALAWGDPAAPHALVGAHAFGDVVRALCPDHRAAALLAPLVDDPAGVGAFAWSERAVPAHEGLTTRAERDGGQWVLTGVKTAVHNAARATHLAVAAQVDASRGWDGVGVFVVDPRAGGVTRVRTTTVGLDGAEFGSVTLAGVRVDDDARLDAGACGGALHEAFQRIALRSAARAVGLGRAAVELALAYTQDRVAFGKPVAHYQAIAFALADRHTEVEAASLLVRRAAALWDAGARDVALAAVACATSFRAAMRAADDAVQLHGGAGFMRDYLPEKLLRDARVLSLCGMSPATLDLVAAARELGLAFDPARELPVPGAQPVFV